jgi:hypothetical protein
VKEALAGAAAGLLHADVLQVGVRQPGMRDQARCARAGAFELTLKPEAEVEVGELRLAVGAPRAVATVEVRVGRVDGAAHMVRRARHGHDPRAVGA